METSLLGNRVHGWIYDERTGKEVSKKVTGQVVAVAVSGNYFICLVRTKENALIHIFPDEFVD